MKNWLLLNWKAKIASLVLAVAIWFLIDSNIKGPSPNEFPIPGEGGTNPGNGSNTRGLPPAPVFEPSPVPGTPKS